MTGRRLASRGIVQIDFSVGRRTIFREHADELADRARRNGAGEVASKLAASADGDDREQGVTLDSEHEAALLTAIDGWMHDAHGLPDDILALRHALRRHGI